MKVLLRYRTCEITFDEADPYYPGKTVELHGESPDDTTFYIYRSEKMYWSVPSPQNPNRTVGMIVKDAEKEKLLSHLIEKAQAMGYKLMLW